MQHIRYWCIFWKSQKFLMATNFDSEQKKNEIWFLEKICSVFFEFLKGGNFMVFFFGETNSPISGIQLLNFHHISNCAMVISHPCILFYSCTWWAWISIVEFCAMVFILEKAILIHIDCHATYAPLRIFAQWTSKKSPCIYLSTIQNITFCHCAKMHNAVKYMSHCF